MNKDGSSSSQSIYFPGLNSLRFFAALMVVISHVEELKDFWGLRSEGIWDLHVLTLMGELAVTFFFVLSGFLIIYLLMKEKVTYGTISLKNFYVRRVLRIFPLYYLTIILGLFIFPQFGILDFPEWTDKIHDSFWIKAFLFLTFFSNLAAVTIFPIPYVSHTWSIGAEEQFYLFIPFLIKTIKNTLNLLVGLILLYLIIAKGLWWLNESKGGSIRILDVAARFIDLTRFDCMAIGGLGAYAVFHQKHKILQFIYQKPFQIIIYAFTFIAYFTGHTFGYFTHEIYSILFAFIILNIATNPNSFFQLEQPILKYLGKISYGIYMYHLLCIRLAMILVEQMGIAEENFSSLENILVYIFSILLTILISTLSYEYFEKWFLNLKPKFTLIKSGEHV